MCCDDLFLALIVTSLMCLFHTQAGGPLMKRSLFYSQSVILFTDLFMESVNTTLQLPQLRWERVCGIDYDVSCLAVVVFHAPYNSFLFTSFSH